MLICHRWLRALSCVYNKSAHTSLHRENAQTSMTATSILSRKTNLYAQVLQKEKCLRYDLQPSDQLGNDPSRADHFSARSVHFVCTSLRLTQHISYKFDRMDSKPARCQACFGQADRKIHRVRIKGTYRDKLWRLDKLLEKCLELASLYIYNTHFGRKATQVIFILNTNYLKSCCREGHNRSCI